MTPDVLLALQERQTNFLPQIAAPAAQQRIDARVVEVQNGSYGWIYRNTPAVRIVVDTIERNIRQLPLHLFERIGDNERHPANDHPAAVSVRYPNSSTPGSQLVAQIVNSLLVYDNAYVYKEPGPGTQTTLVSLRPDMVGLIGQNFFYPEGYRVWRRDGSFFDVEPNQVIHWRGTNPQDFRLGVSPLETLRKTLMEDAASQQANLELMKSGLPPGWISRPVEADEWSKDALGRLRENWTNQRADRTKTPVLDEGMQFHPYGFSPKDADQLGGRRFTIEQVAEIYGLPLGLVGLGSSSLEVEIQQFYADVLPPYCKLIEDFLNLGLLQGEYGVTDYYFSFDLDEKLQGESRIATYVSAAGGPVYTRDEIRRKLDLPPLPDGDGEEIITPLNVTVGGKPSPAVMPPQDPNAPPQDGSHRNEPPAPTTASIEPPHPNGNGNAPDALPEAQTKALEVTTKPRVQADVIRQRTYIEEATHVFDRYYRRQAQSMKSKGLKAANDSRWNKELAKDLLALIASIVSREAGIYLSHLGGASPFDSGEVTNYLKAMAEGTAEGINAATQRDIADFSVQDAFDRAINERAAVAGRSIGTRSTFFARQEAAKQSPNPHDRIQTWIKDTKRHAALDGTSVPLGERWPGGLEPGSEPNCACTATIS